MSMEANEIFDPKVLVTLREEIGDAVIKVVKVYLDDTPNSLQKMQQALTQNDLETVKRLAHSLKSSSANVGAMQMSFLARNLEQELNQGTSDATKIAAAIKEMHDTFDLTQPMFEEFLQK